MESLSNLIQFVERFVSSVTSFTDSIFAFMSYEITVWDTTVFEVIVGTGITVYLGTAIAKWLVGIIT